MPKLGVKQLLPCQCAAITQSKLLKLHLTSNELNQANWHSVNNGFSINVSYLLNYL